METIYYKTSNYIQHSGKVIDLNEVRRRQEAAAQRDSLARQPEAWRAPEEEPAFRPVVVSLTPEQRRRERRERRAWRLEACASLAMILMTAVFVLRMLL